MPPDNVLSHTTACLALPEIPARADSSRYVAFPYPFIQCPGDASHLVLQLPEDVNLIAVYQALNRCLCRPVGYHRQSRKGSRSKTAMHNRLSCSAKRFIAQSIGWVRLYGAAARDVVSVGMFRTAGETSMSFTSPRMVNAPIVKIAISPVTV